MSRLFQRTNAGWAPVAIGGGREVELAASVGPGVYVVEPGAAAGSPAAARVLRIGSPDGAGVDVLLAPRAGVWPLVNGLPMAAGLRVLADRDAITHEGGWFVYGATEPAMIEAFPREQFPEAVFCPRCNTELAGGLAIRCQCGTWFHQDGERACFTYGGTCPVCRAPTVLDAGDWSPDQL